MSEDLLIEDRLTEGGGGIRIATLNRPEKLNALSQAIFTGLHEAVKEYSVRDDLRCFLIRSTGRYFCAGADILRGIPVPDTASTRDIRHWYRKSIGPGMLDLYDDMEAIEKPFVVAHHATCVGGGLEMSLSCDFRLAARSASYHFPEAKLGSMPASGGVSRFTRLVGAHWAKWIIMADQPIGAEQALNIGLVHAVYEDDEFEARVMEFCERMASFPPEMTAMTKLTIDLVADATPGRARAIERLGQSMLQVGDEQVQMFAAMQANLDRRS